jgi:hypothetical protein
MAFLFAFEIRAETVRRQGGCVNWKLILRLSLFGLAMGIGTVFFISSKMEPFLWLPIFLLCAYLIALRANRRFLHGLFVGLANSVWITSVHILFFGHYIATHAPEAAMFKSMPLPESPRLMMALMGPAVGVVSGVVIGLLAMLAGALFRRPRAVAG